MTDHLTLLASPATVGTKTYTPSGAIAFSAGAGPFEARRIPIRGLDEAAALIMRVPGNAFVVRGRTDLAVIPYRRHVSREGEPATLTSEAHRLLPVDWDDPETGEPRTDLRAMASEARDMLPEGLRHARCFAVATSSAGVKPGKRVRLWFWCDREVSDHDAKAWLADLGDHSIYTPSQPIYCAPPRFDGMADPFPDPGDRFVWLDGAEEAQVPASFAHPQPTPGGFLEAFAAAKVHNSGAVGTRNNTLTSLAGTLRKRGVSAEVIASALHARNNEFPEPLEAREVDAIARSVSSYEPEAVAVPSKAATKTVERARKRAEKLVADDPSLVSQAATILARHVRTGALTERQALNTLQSGIDAAPIASAHTPDDLRKILDGAPVIEATVPHWASECILDEDGNPVPCPENLRVILTNHPDFSLWFNSRSQEDWWSACPWRSPGPVTGNDDVAMRFWLSRNLGWHRAPTEPLAAFSEVARLRSWDPWKGYLDALEWDGTQRLTDAAAALLGCDDTEANGLMFAWWLISSVARTYQPGCQVDYILVLEGLQGERKTGFLRTLAVDSAFFTRMVTGADLSSPRTIARIHGPVIIEMAELAVLKRAETEAFKAFADERVDRVQWLYAKKPINIPRTCVFAATTNESTYLKDITGNRRFWPIRCKREINLDLVASLRDQLWAEAVAAYHAGARWWPEKTEAERLGLADIQHARLETEPCADAVDRALTLTLTPGRHGLTGAEVTRDMLDTHGHLVRGTLREITALAGLTAKDSRSVSRYLKILGWEVLRSRAKGARPRLWTAPDADARGDYPEVLN